MKPNIFDMYKVLTKKYTGKEGDNCFTKCTAIDWSDKRFLVGLIF